MLAEQLARIRRREADGLVIARLDRLTRSLSHLGTLLDDAHARRWVLVALDVGVDLSTPAGVNDRGLLDGVAPDPAPETETVTPQHDCVDGPASS